MRLCSPPCVRRRPCAPQGTPPARAGSPGKQRVGRGQLHSVPARLVSVAAHADPEGGRVGPPPGPRKMRQRCHSSARAGAALSLTAASHLLGDHRCGPGPSPFGCASPCDCRSRCSRRLASFSSRLARRSRWRSAIRISRAPATCPDFGMVFHPCDRWLAHSPTPPPVPPCSASHASMTRSCSGLGSLPNSHCRRIGVSTWKRADTPSGRNEQGAL